jgi:hypothetical protein
MNDTLAPTQDANDPQACIRHLRTELAEYEHTATKHAAHAGQLARKLAVCQAEGDKLREPCLSILTTIDYTNTAGSVCVVTRESLDRIKAALEPTDAN